MADDVTLPGTGAVVATDDDATRHWQLIKVVWGPLGTFNLADVASGKPLPVQLRGSDGTDRSNALPVTGTFWQATQPISGTVTANLSATDNAILDAIQAAVEILDNAVSGSEVQVDVLTLPALAAGTNNIGDVDVLSIIPGTAATNLGKAIDTALGATDTGVLALFQRDDVLTAYTPADGDVVAPRVTANGAVWVQPQTAGTATLSTVASATSSAQMLAANTARLGVYVYNTDANGCYIKYGTTASATSFSVFLPANSHWEMPNHPLFTGRIDIIWVANGAGSAFVTELSL